MAGVVHNDSDAKEEAEPEPAKTKTTTAAAFRQLLNFLITRFRSTSKKGLLSSNEYESTQLAGLMSLLAAILYKTRLRVLSATTTESLM